MLCPKCLEGGGSQADIAQCRIAFFGESPKPSDCGLVELRRSATCIATDKGDRVDQTELSNLPRSHLCSSDVVALKCPLEASVCCALAGHRLDAAGATAVSDDSQEVPPGLGWLTVRAFALVEVGHRQAIDLFVRWEDAYAALENTLGDEP